MSYWCDDRALNLEQRRLDAEQQRAEERQPDKALKPCPFCGSDCVNDTSPPENNGDHVFQWVCPDCVAVGPYAESVEEATALWNDRSPKREKIK